MCLHAWGLYSVFSTKILFKNISRIFILITCLSTQKSNATCTTLRKAIDFFTRNWYLIGVVNNKQVLYPKPKKSPKTIWTIVTRYFIKFGWFLTEV